MDDKVNALNIHTYEGITFNNIKQRYRNIKFGMCTPQGQREFQIDLNIQNYMSRSNSILAFYLNNSLKNSLNYYTYSNSLKELFK